MNKLAVLGAFAALSLSSAAAGAADLASPAPPPPAPAPAPGWQFEVTIPGWLAGLDGTIGVGRLPSASVNASFSDIVKNLQGVFAGTVIAHNDTYIVGLDVFWTRVGDSITFKANGDGPFANLRSGSTASLTQDTTIATAFAGYRLPIGTPNLNLYGTLGARYQDLSATVSLSHTFPGRLIFQQPTGFTVTSNGGVGWVDPVVGLAMNYRIDDRWFLEGYGDIGGLGGGSNFTSEGILEVGYNWTKTVSTELGFRALYSDYQQSNNNGGSFRYNTTMYGPVVALSFHF